MPDMNESAKGTIYATLAVLLFATLGTGFKLSVARLDGYSVAVYMGVFAVLALLVNLFLTGRARLRTRLRVRSSSSSDQGCCSASV